MADDFHETGAIAALRIQLACLRAAVVVLVPIWLATTAVILFRSPAVLTVERLEIVEPDGRRALVIANSQRPIAATVDGQVVMSGQEEERRGLPSIIFFDGQGDEVGGMLFGVRETPDGFRATRHFSWDANGQDQTIVLAHNQDPDGSTSGLTISNRPRHSQLDTFARLGLEPGATRQQLNAAIAAIPEGERRTRLRELFGTTRAFFGSARTGEARLELRDGRGRPRIVIDAPEEGEPSTRVLDEDGAPVLRLPG